MKREIDFVVLWVDGNDPEWRAEKAKYSPSIEIADAEERYREWGLLPFWFRGVEKFAPWVRKVHFVTWGHLPKWLNIKAPKLHIVRHEDYIPDKYLPVFNSSAIEVGIHRIPDLADKFVFFNDDMYLIKPFLPTDFFVGDKVVDMLALQPVVANPKNPIMSHIYINNSLVLCKYFDKRGNMKKQPGAYFKLGYPLMYWGYNVLEKVFPLFTGFYTIHAASPYIKHTFEEVWEKEGDLLNEVQSHRFRDNGDVSQYLFREWQKLSGDFVPKNIQKYTKYFEIKNDNTKLIQTIEKQKCKMLCINDSAVKENIDQIKKQLIQAFTSILPQKSSFEI